MSCRTTETVLREVERLSASHAAWLERVHRVLLFGAAYDLSGGRLPEPVLAWAQGDEPVESRGRRVALARLRLARADMLAQAARLGRTSHGAGNISPADYSAFMAAVDRHGRRLRALEDLLRRALSETDPLTGVHNRRGMVRDLERERSRSQRTGQPCCVALADLDHFKAINDMFGHQAGDRVLEAAARFFRRRLRPYDLIYRFGGEEFLFCLPNTDLPTARKVLDRLRILMARVPVVLGDGRKVRLTVSIGVAEMMPEAACESAVARADAACYAAKRAGRNRVCVAAPGNGTGWLACVPESAGPAEPRRQAGG